MNLELIQSILNRIAAANENIEAAFSMHNSGLWQIYITSPSGNYIIASGKGEKLLRELASKRNYKDIIDHTSNRVV